MFALISTAWGAPLVSDGDLEKATIIATKHGVDPASIDPISFEDLLHRPPVLMAGGSVTACAQPTAPQSPQQTLDSAQSALLYGQFDDASAAVEEARAAVLCSPVAVPSELVAKIELVAGLIAEEKGDKETARARYTAALGYDPLVPWPTSYPTDRRGLFDAAHTSAAVAATSLQVRPSSPAPTLDGIPLTAAAPVGEHIVRLDHIAVRVTLDEAPNRLIVPMSYPKDALSWAADDARRSELSALLAATLGEGTDAWIVHGEDAWHGIAGRTDWTSFPGAVPAPVPPIAGERGRRRWGLTLGGAAIAAAGGLTGTLGTLLAKDAAGKGGLEGAEYDALESKYFAGIAMAGTGWGVLAIGTGVTGVGLLLGSTR